MKYFYQDFLFGEIPLDTTEMPLVDIDTIREADIPLPIEGPFPVEPCLTIYLSQLLDLISEEEWDATLSKCEHYPIVYLKDDVPIINEEIAPFKEMYIKTYCWHLSKRCRKVMMAIP